MVDKDAAKPLVPDHRRREHYRGDMSAYEVIEMGGLDAWHEFAGGTTPGKRFVDKELPLQNVGMSANAAEPGSRAPFWHTHEKLEELYVFLAGNGQMGLNDDVVDVQAGTTVRVPPGTWSTWRALPDSPEQLRWLCIRAGGAALSDIGRDGALDRERPAPWAE